MRNTLGSKWYDNKTLIIVLFFVFPPLGIYGMSQRNSVAWKKLLYIIPAVFIIFFVIVGILGAILMDPYKDGVDYYNKQEYLKAYNSLNMVKSDDPNYKDAILKMNAIKPIVDSLALEKVKLDNNEIVLNNDVPKIDLIKFKAFQKRWADSLIKDWHGKYIVKYRIAEDGDTIYLQLNKAASRDTGNLHDINQTIFQKDYDSIYVKNFGNKISPIGTSIKLTPDPEQLLENRKQAERSNKIRMQFSAWDGSHGMLKRWIKDNMNDPDSFDHIQTTYADRGKYILIQMKFRGKNAFGAKVISVVTAKADLDGNILSVDQ